MYSRILLATFLLLTLLTSGQDLVVNGTFEDVNVCTEFRVECAPEAWISSGAGFTNYFRDSKRAYTGMNCMGIEAGHINKPFQRTFIRSRLVCALRKGNNYRIEFYIKSPHPVLDSVGILFSARDPFFDKTPLQKITPSLFLEPVTRPMKIGDSSWRRVELIYTARGDERFIAFGYFATKNFTGKRSHEMENKFFVFLDDIFMNPVDPNERLCDGWKDVLEEIYEENERHTLLEKKIYYYTKNPPPPPTLNKTIILRVDTLVIPDILFATGKSDLRPPSFSLLDSFCTSASYIRVDSIVVEGHTDNAGSLALNQKLSIDRAETVRKYIGNRTGISPIIARGWDYSRPVATNDTPEGRQKNRRVEVFLYIRDY